MTKLYLSTIALLAIIAITLSLALPALAQSPVDNAQATISAATAQAQQSQWNRQAQATRQAQSLQATTQASAIEAESTRQAVIINASATAQAQDIQIEATRQAHLGNIGATATYQAVQIQHKATQEAVALDATRQAYDIALAEMQERSDIGTALLYLSAVVCGLFLIGFAMWLFGRLPHSEPLEPIEIIEATYTTQTPLLLPSPNTLVMTEIPDELEDVIEELINDE